MRVLLDHHDETSLDTMQLQLWKHGYAPSGGIELIVLIIVIPLLLGRL